jgi:hypothetical protein
MLAWRGEDAQMTNEEFARDTQRLADIYRHLGERQTQRRNLSIFGAGGMPLPPDQDRKRLLKEADTILKALKVAIVDHRT